MTIFEAAKSTVTLRMAAEHFGLNIGRNGMVCCPFHNDRHPSMKLNEDYFYCFGCGAKEDVIEFTSKLFGVTALEAAQKLSADFTIQTDRPSVLTKLSRYQTQADHERLCFRVLREYLQILQDWKVRFSPQTPEYEPDDHFVEACHWLARAEYYLDTLIGGISYERNEVIEMLMTNGKLKKLQKHLKQHRREETSNPDIDTARSNLNFHLVTPERKYRAEAEKQIAEAGCRTRSDSVRVVEALVTASPEFFKGKKKSEVRAYFTEALDFIQKYQSKDTIISAVVHMDEKTPYMHLCFVPLTEDKRLSAKEIVGNKKKLTWWQDEFWQHMVKKYPDLERGESASETGRTHIPPRLFKEAVHLNRMKNQIMAILNDSNPFNKKAKAEELEALLDKYIPGVEAMRTKLKKYDKTYKELTEENAELEKKLSSASRESVRKKLEINQKLNELDELRRTVEVLPPEILQAAKKIVAHKPQER